MSAVTRYGELIFHFTKSPSHRAWGACHGYGVVSWECVQVDGRFASSAPTGLISPYASRFSSIRNRFHCLSNCFNSSLLIRSIFWSANRSDRGEMGVKVIACFPPQLRQVNVGARIPRCSRMDDRSAVIFSQNLTTWNQSGSPCQKWRSSSSMSGNQAR